MSILNHSILPATEADLPVIAGFLLASKLQLAVNRFLFKDWPNEPAQRDLYTSAVEGGFKDPQSTTLKVVDDRSGETVAHLILKRRTGGEAKEPAVDVDGTQEVPRGMDPDVLPTVMRMIREVDEEMQGIDHIRENDSVHVSCIFTDRYLEITHIYVKPTSRRQGIGSQLVQLSIEKAKAAGVPLAIASEPDAHEFFLRQGFRDTKHSDIDLSQWAPPHSGWGVFRLAGMIRSE